MVRPETHRPSQPRQWRKVHLGIAADALEIRASAVTGSRVGEAPRRLELLDRIPADRSVGKVTADGAYDRRGGHAAIAARQACAAIPTRRNRRPWPEHRPGEQARSTGQKRNSPRDTSPRQDDLAELQRVPPTKPGRNQDALLQAVGRTRHGPRLRPAGGRATNQGGDPEPLHGPCNTANSPRGMPLSKGRGNSASGRIVQPCPMGASPPILFGRSDVR